MCGDGRGKCEPKGMSVVGDGVSDDSRAFGWGAL